MFYKKVFLKLFLIFSFLINSTFIFSATFQELAQRYSGLQEIQYNDFVAAREGRQSWLTNQFEGLRNFQEKIEKLKEFCGEKSDSEAGPDDVLNEALESHYLYIGNLPQKSGKDLDNYLILNIDFQGSVYHFSIEDSNLNLCLIASIGVQNSQGNVDKISGEHEDVFRFGNAVSGPVKLSGSTIMNIWDSLCYLLRPVQIKLVDVSSVDGFQLRVLRPYVSANHLGWYENYGYYSVYNSAQEYKDKVGLLISRELKDICSAFSHDEELINALRYYHDQICDCGHVENCQKTIGELSRHAYLRYINESLDDEVHSQEIYFFQELYSRSFHFVGSRGDIYAEATNSLLRDNHLTKYY